ncbi:hypothetical protein M2G67_20510 [Vibrio vulnificus]|nr:hypothetical protein [Vibrio vulnificus]
MATKFAHNKLTQLTAALSIAFSATTTAGLIAPGGSESFNLEFKGAIATPGEAWNFSVPAQTVQKVGELHVNTSMAKEESGMYVWEDLTDGLDLIYGYVDGAAAGSSAFNPEIQVSGVAISPGELRQDIKIPVTDIDMNAIGELHMKNVRHWASAVFAMGRDFGTGASVSLKFSDGMWIEDWQNLAATPGMVLFKDRLVDTSVYMENRVKGFIDTNWEVAGSQSSGIELGVDTFDYHGQRLITVDATDLKIDLSKNADFWRSDLSMIVTLK